MLRKRVLLLWVVAAVVVTLLLLEFLKSIQKNSITVQRPVSCCGPHCRVKKGRPTTHYSEKYFLWQTKLGLKKAHSRDWGAFLNVSKYDTVADLGAGGGHILATLNVKRRIAVEVNDNARQSITRMYGSKIEVFEYPEQVKDRIVDLLFSTSAIEHFECPLTELREMSKKVRSGGTVFVGVLNEGIAIGIPAKQNDRNQHLYTWNYQQLYNLMTSAGFTVTGFIPNSSYALDVHAQKFKYPDSFKSHAASDMYIWVKGVKI